MLTHHVQPLWERRPRSHKLYHVAAAAAAAAAAAWASRLARRCARLPGEPCCSRTCLAAVFTCLGPCQLHALGRRQGSQLLLHFRQVSVAQAVPVWLIASMGEVACNMVAEGASSPVCGSAQTGLGPHTQSGFSV